MDYLRRLHYQSRWMTPSEVLGAVVADRRMLEVSSNGPRAQDQWRRLRFVLDQARAWSEVEHGGLRSYLVWAAKQGEDSSRVAEAVLPETDVDAVRIMTIHGAKGLEFPMVVLSGMTSAPRRQSGVRLLWKPDGYAVSITKAMQTNDFQDVAPIDEQMDSHERRRLLYVATTRARDHLVVSLHRGEGGAETNAKVLAAAGAITAGGAVAFDRAAFDRAHGDRRSLQIHAAPRVGGVATPDRGDPSAHPTHPGTECLRSGGNQPEVALNEEPAQIAGLAKGGRDVDLPPWRKGRYGAAIGRAAHAVLQTINLATGEGLEDAVAAQCLSEGVVAHADYVTRLVRSALASQVVKRAAARPHWREPYVGAVQADGTVLEGFVDLLYREDDGSLVVVDYKTDQSPADALPARRAHYGPQMAAYQVVLNAATGSEVKAELLFLDAHTNNGGQRAEQA